MLGFQKTSGYHKKAYRSESVHDLEILNTEQEMKQRLIHSKYNEKIFNIKVLKPRKFYKEGIAAKSILLNQDA